MLTVAKRLLVGRPLASSEKAHQRIPNLVALPVFASDAISSTAHATDEILVVLLAQTGIGVAAFSGLVPTPWSCACCWPSWSSATARRSSPTPAVAAATS